MKDNYPVEKEEKQKISRKQTAASLSGYKYPDFGALQNKTWPDYSSKFTDALNYANYMFELGDLKSFTQKFCSTQDDCNYNLTKIPDREFYFIGQIAWLHINKVDFEQQYIADIKVKIKKLYDTYNAPSDIVVVDNKAKRTSIVIGEFSGLIDDVLTKKSNITPPINFIEQAGGISAIYPDVIRSHFQSLLDEVSDEALSEYFPDKKQLIATLGVILSALEKSKDNKTKRISKTKRKPKKVNPVKLVKNLKYQQDDKDLNIKSISPETIIGNQILWVYNTKTNKIGQYVAMDNQTLSIKGSTILNYDEAKSKTKKVRKPKETLDRLIAAGKIDQRKLLESIHSVESPLNGRINPQTLLVKIY